MSPERASIVAALEAERADAAKGVSAEVVAVSWDDEFVVLTVKAKPGRATLKLDDQLEGVRAKWGAEFNAVGIIKLVDAEEDRIVLRLVAGSAPIAGNTLWVFPGDFLGPLRDLWAGEEGRRAIARYKQSQTDLAPLHAVSPLPAAFADLRERQVLAVQSFAYRSALIQGPPGTGKSYTVGALVAYLLTNFTKARVLLVGPTNIAVDGALLAIDDWLARLGRPDLSSKMKRVGAHFDPRRYVERSHLLAPGIADAANAYLVLEALEPSRANIADYVRWKERLAAARQALSSDIADACASSRVVAMTAATAVRWHDAVVGEQSWHFTICDEASQMLGPTAMMVASVGQQAIFAGDPQQLAPIVKTGVAPVRNQLTRTAFDLYAHSHTVRLNEQSRMALAICQVVGRTFYDNDLMVCRKAARDPAWKKDRSPFFVDGREVPRVCFQQISEPCAYSQRYGGFIRFQSAKLVEQVCDDLAGSYVDADEVMILTPFRAQRALIRSMLRRRHPEIAVSTVHRAQGSERTLIVFDPVDGNTQMLTGTDGARLINVALSRAKAHVIIPYFQADLDNASLKQVHRLATAFWHKAGAYATPFAFKVAA